MHMPAARCSLCYLLCMSACAMHVNLVFCWGVGHIESITESGAHEGGLGVWGDMALCGSNRLQGIGSVLDISHGASTRVHTENLRGAGPPPVKDWSVQDITRWDEDW